MNSNELLEHIKSNSGLSDEELLVRVAEKQRALEGLLSKEGALYIIANELGIGKDIYSKQTPIEKLVPGMRYGEICGEITRVFAAKNYQKNDKQGFVGSFIVQDATASTRVVLWDDQTKLLDTLNKGDKIKIKDPIVRAGPQGTPELHVTSATKLAVSSDIMYKPLSTISEKDSMLNVYGTIVAAHELRFFEQCPSCRKRMTLQGDWLCPLHGSQQPVYGYVLPLIIDDGTANFRVILFSKQVEFVLGLGESQIINMKDNSGAIADVRKSLLGKEVMLTCSPKKNKFFSSLELHVTNVKFPTPEQVLHHLKQL